MEKDFLENLPRLSPGMRIAATQAIGCQIIYADPMDLTKMLNFQPGTKVLEGVREVQNLFYPQKKGSTG